MLECLVFVYFFPFSFSHDAEEEKNSCRSATVLTFPLHSAIVLSTPQTNLDSHKSRTRLRFDIGVEYAPIKTHNLCWNDIPSFFSYRLFKSDRNYQTRSISIFRILCIDLSNICSLISCHEDTESIISELASAQVFGKNLFFALSRVFCLIYHIQESVDKLKQTADGV